MNRERGFTLQLQKLDDWAVSNKTRVGGGG